MHTKILVPGPASRARLLSSTPPTHTPGCSLYTWWCTYKPTRRRSSIHEKEWGWRCYRMLPGVVAPVPHAGLLIGFRACVRMCFWYVYAWVHVCARVSELHRPPNTRYTLRATLSHLLVAALCGTTRPPWFHSWLHWLIFARCPRTLERTCTYAARRSSFNTHRDGGCWMQEVNLENLGNRGEDERESSRFYSREDDLRYFLEDEISKEMKSSWLWLRSF